MAARRKKELATYMQAATGAGDANSGGGAGSGIPDAETALRAGDQVTTGDVAQDKAKLFPDRFAAGNRRGAPGAKSKPAGKAHPGQGVRQTGAKRPPAAKSARKAQTRATTQAKPPAARAKAPRGKQRT